MGRGHKEEGEQANTVLTQTGTQNAQWAVHRHQDIPGQHVITQLRPEIQGENHTRLLVQAQSEGRWGRGQ